MRLVDLNRVSGQSTVEYSDHELKFGWIVRLASLRESAKVGDRAPLLWAALRHVAHVQIRTRATLGGNPSQADPASEVPALAVAWGATYTLSSSGGTRTVAAAECAIGPHETSCAPDEGLTSVSFPLFPRTGAGFYEIARKAKDWPGIGVGAQLQLSDIGQIVRAWIAARGVKGTPIKLEGVEPALIGNPLEKDTIKSAATIAVNASDYPGARSHSR